MLCISPFITESIKILMMKIIYNMLHWLFCCPWLCSWRIELADCFLTSYGWYLLPVLLTSSYKQFRHSIWKAFLVSMYVCLIFYSSACSSMVVVLRFNYLLHRFVCINVFVCLHEHIAMCVHADMYVNIHVCITICMCSV